MNYIKQDITKVTSGLIMHGVNCMGAMHSGVALAIKTKWPMIYDIFKTMPIGRDMLGQTHMISITDDLYVANCYTQLNYGYDKTVRYASIDAVQECIEACFLFAEANKFDISTPRIASDRGGLSWGDEVQPIFFTLNKQYIDVTVNVYYI